MAEGERGAVPRSPSEGTAVLGRLPGEVEIIGLRLLEEVRALEPSAGAGGGEGSWTVLEMLRERGRTPSEPRRGSAGPGGAGARPEGGSALPGSGAALGSAPAVTAGHWAFLGRDPALL